MHKFIVNCGKNNSKPNKNFQKYQVLPNDPYYTYKVSLSYKYLTKT